jgi:tRNA nucleotidyltransferase/poly(A) polymerase
MHYTYNFVTRYEKFGVEVYCLLVENFLKTYFTGGTVRDMLLQKKLSDLDIATEAKPDEVLGLLAENGIDADVTGKAFGVITARRNNMLIEIATLRKDSYKNSRYPKVAFTKSLKSDSLRRDFALNSLYYDHKSSKIIDFHGGISDIRNRKLVFIGDALRSITQDPLRIVRAYRFAGELDLKIDKHTENILQNNLHLLKGISKSRFDKEISKIGSLQRRKKVLKVMHKYT